jgi:hypothetical protein
MAQAAAGQAAAGYLSRRFRGRAGGVHGAGKGRWFRSPGIEGCKSMVDQGQREQLLHLVFGGELTNLDRVEFRDLDKLDIVGIYPNYAAAYAAWKAKAQQTVDNAHMRYFIVHLHRLLDPQMDQRAKR